MKLLAGGLSKKVIRPTELGFCYSIFFKCVFHVPFWHPCNFKWRNSLTPCPGVPVSVGCFVLLLVSDFAKGINSALNTWEELVFSSANPGLSTCPGCPDSGKPASWANSDEQPTAEKIRHPPIPFTSNWVKLQSSWLNRKRIEYDSMARECKDIGFLGL